MAGTSTSVGLFAFVEQRLVSEFVGGSRKSVENEC